MGARINFLEAHCLTVAMAEVACPPAARTLDTVPLRIVQAGCDFIQPVRTSQFQYIVIELVKGGSHEACIIQR